MTDQREGHPHDGVPESLLPPGPRELIRRQITDVSGGYPSDDFESLLLAYVHGWITAVIDRPGATEHDLAETLRGLREGLDEACGTPAGT